MWRCGQVPKDFKGATIVHLYKRNGNRQVWDNHIAAGEVPGTRAHLYTTFVDLTEAFDTVNREGLWKIMQKFGWFERSTHTVRQLHDGIMTRVTDSGAVLEAFGVTNGVKQGCVLAPTLFSLLFTAMLMDGDERPGIRVAYMTDGHLLNSRRMLARTRLFMTTIHDLFFADDCALNTTTEVDMLRNMDHFTAENRIAAAKAQREARISKVSRLLTASHPPLPTFPCCQRAFRPRIGFFGHLRKQCVINLTASTSSPTFAHASNLASTATPVNANDTVAVPPPPSVWPNPSIGCSD
ncbi:hypothetical protein SprV_0100143600 [Sparganum proliferum]